MMQDPRVFLIPETLKKSRVPEKHVHHFNRPEFNERQESPFCCLMLTYSKYFSVFFNEPNDECSFGPEYTIHLPENRYTIIKKTDDCHNQEVIEEACMIQQMHALVKDNLNSVVQTICAMPPIHSSPR
jgi:hypothetical protein